MTSGALWIVLLWIFIVGSRPVSLWFGLGKQWVRPEDIAEGSPLDRYIFIVLIALGLMVLHRRRIIWSEILASNRVLFIFFLYCGISVTWSEYPFVSFKRWVKDFGNVVMVLIILSDKYPAKATKAVLARFTYIAIPLSVLFIKYFPDFGRYYNRWTYNVTYCGIGTEKNSLGLIVLTGGLYLFWDFIETRTTGESGTDWSELAIRIVLSLMGGWLLAISNSATALVCLILGAGTIYMMRLPLARRQVRHLGTYSLAAISLILLIYFAPTILGSFTGIVGRNTTFTGRTNIWAGLLQESTNPIIGTGYQSFWTLDMRERYDVNSAHNGYLETYLSGGWIGVCLLIAMIVSAGRKMKGELLTGNSYSFLLFSFIITAVYYNLTEAMFGGLSLIWITFLLAALTYPGPHSEEKEEEQDEYEEETSLDFSPNGNPRNTIPMHTADCI
jgi:O-antigen ligase